MANALCNLIWFILGGFLIALLYLVSSLLLILTIIGIPFGIQTLKIGLMALAPFGADVAEGNSTTGCLSLFMNILWILLGGFWIAVTHAVLGLICCITIIGIPFGLQHFKLALLALTPFGKRIIR